MRVRIRLGCDRMSYILEALKKSELEREQLAACAEAEAIITPVDSALIPLPLALDSMQKPSIAYLSMIVIAVLAFVYFSFLNTVKLDEPIVESALNLAPAMNIKSEVLAAVEGAPTQQILAVQVAVAKSDITDAMESKALEAKIYQETVEIEEKPEVLSIEQAGESLLAQIPNISITSHIYSSQAKRRSIVVNDERLVEGDFVAAQVQVQEITHQGMILSVSGSLLAVSRSRGWNR